MGQREGQQIGAEIARDRAQRPGRQVHVILQHIAQQVFLAAVVAVQGLLGTAGPLGHRVHAQPHAALGQQRMHSRMDAAVAVRTPGSAVGDEWSWR